MYIRKKYLLKNEDVSYDSNNCIYDIYFFQFE